MNRIIVGLLVLALAYLGIDKFVLGPQRVLQPESAAPSGAVPSASTARHVTATDSTSDERSIAVLPFANMSGNADEDYFSDGMTEELLNVLAKVPQLQVVARTSVFQFKGKGGDVREIGRKLGVTNIVEGSVRRDGEKVRITAQLVRVSDGFHIWSESYDRKLEGVFALQDDIAQHIGKALKVSLGVNAPVQARVAIDPAAYDDYLKGRQLMRARTDLASAIAHFKAAVARAPDFAAAWSSLSLTYEVTFWYTTHLTPADQSALLAGEATAAERAADLDPDAAASEHALGNVARAQFKFADAERHYLRAMQIDPGYPDVREDYSELLYEVGRLDDSLRAARQLVSLDPYFAVGWYRVINNTIALDQRDAVEDAVRHARAIAPDQAISKISLIDFALAHGRADEARSALAEVQELWPRDAATARVLLPWALGATGFNAEKVREAIADAVAGDACLYLIARGDVDGYNAYLEQSGAIIQAYYFAYLNSSTPAGHKMLGDPRVKAELERLGFAAYWREKGWPAVCRPLGDTDFECGINVEGAH